MADDFDRSIGGIIAVAMQSTVVAFIVAVITLAAASLLFATAYEYLYGLGFINLGADEIVGTAVFAFLMGVPWSFMLIWGIPVALFQVYCFYAILYEDGNRWRRAVWLFFSQLVASCLCLGAMNNDWATSVKALLLSAFIGALPLIIRLVMRVASCKGSAGPGTHRA